MFSVKQKITDEASGTNSDENSAYSIYFLHEILFPYRILIHKWETLSYK